MRTPSELAQYMVKRYGYREGFNTLCWRHGDAVTDKNATAIKYYRAALDEIKKLKEELK